MVINFFKKVARGQAQAGFTLIELVVIIAIFAIMSSVLLFNFRGFNKNVERNNLAQDMALLIRKTQSYGISSSTLDANTLTETNTLPSRYGLLFDYDASAGTITSISSYKKIGGSNVPVSYTQGTDILIDTVVLNSPGVSVVACISNGGSTCTTPILSDIAIEFERPRPEPLISNGQYSFLLRLMPSDSLIPWYIVVAPTGNIYVKR
jgi:prepilin-type N-terminal cleavage/methylation domain-containing protein